MRFFYCTEIWISLREIKSSQVSNVKKLTYWLLPTLQVRFIETLHDRGSAWRTPLSYTIYQLQPYSTKITRINLQYTQTSVNLRYVAITLY